MEEKEYEFVIHEKITMWEAVKFNVWANSKEEALKLATEVFDTSEYPDDNDCQSLLETQELIEVGDNGGAPTKILYFDDNILKTNG
jgi:mannitol/fructose-specific phosphotransferase system IIA component (Ntr-type)